MSGQLRSSTLDIYEIELFEWYVKETESVLDGILATERAYIEEQTSSGIEDVNDSGMVAVEYYIKRIRYSHVIYLTSLVETCLERACSALTSHMRAEELPFGLNELAGDQWSKKRKYLERYGRFEFPRASWSAIQVLILVRNYLVHENGSTANLKPDQKKSLQKYLGLRIDGHEFAIERTYIDRAFQAVRSFVETLEAEMTRAVRRA
jgi:hypothetical protein